MSKLDISRILVKDAKLNSNKISDINGEVIQFINCVKQKQAEVLKLKEVDQNRLRMVVQL